MYDTPRTNEQIITMLAGMPALLEELTAGLSPEQLVAAPGPADAMHPGEWSARDVLAHLRACSDMWGRYIAQILNEDRPTIKAVSPRTWIHKTDFLAQEFRPSLEAFKAQREGLVAVLRALAAEEWQRGAVVTGVGKTVERTVYTYAQWLANHERSHVRQMEQIASAVSK